MFIRILQTQAFVENPTRLDSWTSKDPEKLFDRYVSEIQMDSQEVFGCLGYHS